MTSAERYARLMVRVRRVYDEHPRSTVACAALIALGVRLITLGSFSKSIYATELMPDEQIYDICARAILGGTSPPNIVGFTTLVPAYVFSAAYAVLGADPSSVRFLNVLLGSGTCICLYLTGHALAGRSTGLITALLGAFYGPFILASVTAHKTALELFLIGCTTALGVRAVVRPRLVEIALFGTALGLSTHVRANAVILIFVAPLALWLVRRGRGVGRPLLAHLLAYAVGLAIVLVPLSSGGILGATEHGFNLYLANSLDNPTPYYRPASFAPAQPSLQGGGFVLKASLEEGRTLSTAEAREHYSSRLWAEWLADPRAGAAKALAKMAASVNVYEHAHNHNLAFISRFVPPLAWPWVGFGLLFPLAVLGMVDGRSVPERQWLSLMAIGYWVTLVVFFTEIRLRAPFALMLMPLGALGLQSIFERRRCALAIAALVLAGSSVVTHLPVPGAGDLTTAHNLHALLLFDTGDYEGAARYYQMAHELPGLDSESALLGLAAISSRRGELQAARDLLEQITDASYAASEKYDQLGGLLVRERRFDEAASAYERALEINPGLLRMYPILELAYARLNQPARAADTRRRYRYARSFFFPE